MEDSAAMTGSIAIRLCDHRDCTVADALARRGTIAQQPAAARSGDAEAADNLQLADLRYRNGIDSYLLDLTARLARYNAARTLVQTRQLYASSRVALYRALGGDASH